MLTLLIELHALARNLRNKLLSCPYQLQHVQLKSQEVQQRLQAKQGRDRAGRPGSHPSAIFCEGQPVYCRLAHRRWARAQIVGRANSPSSYWVRLESGKVLRRNQSFLSAQRLQGEGRGRPGLGQEQMTAAARIARLPEMGTPGGLARHPIALREHIHTETNARSPAKTTVAAAQSPRAHAPPERLTETPSSHINKQTEVQEAQSRASQEGTTDSPITVSAGPASPKVPSGGTCTSKSNNGYVSRFGRNVVKPLRYRSDE